MNILNNNGKPQILYFENNFYDIPHLPRYFCTPKKKHKQINQTAGDVAEAGRQIIIFFVLFYPHSGYVYIVLNQF